MAKQRTKTAPRMNICSSCGGPVKARRKSSSGEHFCPEPACQADKRRFHRQHPGAPAADREDMNTCSNCKGPVRVRRPSDSGQHYCQAPDCRKAASRFYRKRLTTTSDGRRVRAETNEERLELLKDAVSNPRSICDLCGAEHVLPGWAHFMPPGSPPGKYGNVCTYLGNKGQRAGEEWIRAAMPGAVR